MVTPGAKREAVAHARKHHGLSERRAEQPKVRAMRSIVGKAAEGGILVGVSRRVIRYQSTRGDDAPLRARLRELAAERRRFGYRRLGYLLAREGMTPNHKKLRRIYREENLRVRRRGGRKRALRSVYRAETAEAGLAALDAFEAGHWGKRHPAIAQSWRRHWDQVIPFFAFPEGVRRIIYTTNAIEALNSKLRRAVRTRGHFPSDDAAMKLLYLVLNKAAEEWKRPPREWSEAKTQFAVIFGERFVI